MVDGEAAVARQPAPSMFVAAWLLISMGAAAPPSLAPGLATPPGFNATEAAAALADAATASGLAGTAGGAADAVASAATPAGATMPSVRGSCFAGESSFLGEYCPGGPDGRGVLHNICPAGSSCTSHDKLHACPAGRFCAQLEPTVHGPELHKRMGYH